MMPENHIFIKQQNTFAKAARAKELRLEMTPSEKKLWDRLRANRLGGYHFRRQHVIEPYIVDFYCHKAALVVEVDGIVHADQQEYDRHRDLNLISLGLRVIRFSNADVDQNLEGVLGEVLRSCKLGLENPKLD